MKMKTPASLSRKAHSWIVLLILLSFVFNAGNTSIVQAQKLDAETPPDVLVSLSADKTSFGTAEAVTLHVTITNASDHSIRMLKWFTPFEGVEEPLFTVTRNGEPVAYIGRLVKRSAPTEQDYITLTAGESIEGDVDFSDAYDLSVSGTYDVAYNTSLWESSAAGKNGRLEKRTGDDLTSNTLELFIEARAVRKAPMPDALQPLTVSGSNAFVSCSASQQTDLINARDTASTYANNATAYFSSNMQGARYTTWFGTYDASRYNTVSSHFTAIRNATDIASPMTFDCTCTEPYYAYVYPNDPYRIYLCNAFWSAPLGGTDSKAGTLIHEISHFDVVAGTDDYVYGQPGAKNLAITNPAQAIMNADNHEYFAENTPPLEPMTTYSISGNVGVAGATLTYTGGSVIADGSGNYSFTVASGWSGTVTPSKTGYTFTPPSKSYPGVLGNITGQNYTAISSTYYSVSGNAGVAGTTITYTGGSTTADGSGNYSFTVASGWSGTVTPSKTGYTFSPPNKSYTNVSGNLSGQNYTATYTGGVVNLLQDPSFEAYTPNPYWSEFSTNFGTPLCVVTDCGNDGGKALPRTGSVWAWFGGTLDNETGTLSQTVIIPKGSAALEFYFWIGAADAGSGTDDVFTARIDGITLFSANATQISLYPTYTLISVDISAYANGGSHTITFSSTTSGQVVDFNLDDVSLLPAGRTFGDVATSYWAWDYIERLYNADITGGCTTSPLNYCPEATVTRAQMAIFLERGKAYPSSFSPPNVTPTFTDTVGHWAEDWIEALKNDSITSGCGTGLYCPEAPVTRAQMAVFLLKAKHGSTYNPPAVGASTGFGDIPTNHWAAAWIKQLVAEGITSGCGSGNYCPDTPVTRAQMAVFLVKAFGLP